MRSLVLILALSAVCHAALSSPSPVASIGGDLRNRLSATEARQVEEAVERIKEQFFGVTHNVTAPEAAIPCTFSTGGVTLGLQNLISAGDIAGSDGTYNYKFAVCQEVKETTCASHAGALCQYDSSGNYKHMIATWQGAAPQWSLYTAGDTSKGLAINFNNGDNCGVQNLPRQLTANFPCTPNGNNEYTFATSATNPCAYTLTLATPVSCINGDAGYHGGGGGIITVSGGLSGGWAFIIFLIIAITLYIIIGCAWKTKKQGTTGMESCPQIEFWRDLPSLVKDGCLFTVNKIRGKGGDGHYETIK
jgi:hypothetical protein